MTKTFADLGVRDPLVKALAANGITSPFPIQVDTLPDTLAGRDVLGRGKTGSGKTLAFSIPMVARLAGDLAGGKRRPGHPVGLILAPTRELATQISAALEPLAGAYNLKVTTIFGGVSQHRQVQALKAGVDIVVACPGRLEDLMKQKFVSLDAVEITVLDEADHMADLGFLPVVTRILSATPQNGQRLLFSATLDNGVDKLVKRFLHNEVLHSVDEANSPVAAMTHHVFDVAGVEAKKVLVQKLASGTGRRILFMRTKHQARKLARQLTEAGIPSVDLHGNLSQAARDRNLAAFSAGEARVLVATDVAARGVHVDDVELVVHVDPPAEHKAYLHRSGRTARAGSAGDVVTVVLPEQRKDLAILMRKAAIKVTPQQVTADSDPVNALVGEIAPHVVPVPKAAPQPAGNGGGARRGGGGGGQRRSGGSGQAGGGRGGQGGGRGGAQGGGRGGSQGAAAGGGRSSGGRGRGQGSGQPTVMYSSESPRSGGSQGSGNGQRRRATRP
ncbi:DEAD/DEAH box helicase [Rhodococcus tukisamuensis]|uniref:Superfamily II DNA and RNA helicase n=1 Tax=Rhodococcus tukisamuensis TaxID=168276 RepID=A0A1G6XMU3_9NOCA|nr:DEAD/DEAH box helicase [Rhodococcus tukisamuensis]SDD78745.1 Superfamily II DNA and RNA helicase [Rhodococcus tukisamuensis]